MVNIAIDEPSCRGCEMCVDVCPTKVFDFDAARRTPRVREAEDCIACLTCAYLCPSQAIVHTGHPVVRNFYRDLEFVARMERFV